MLPRSAANPWGYVMGSEVAGKADFSGIRYAQCWEDADVLVEGLGVRPGDVCLSIASAGVGGAGKFERYFARFRRRVLPLVHRRRTVNALLRGGTREQRAAFSNRQWDTCRWRLLFRVFFSRFVMGRVGRDPSFFTYVEG